MRSIFELKILRQEDKCFFWLFWNERQKQLSASLKYSQELEKFYQRWQKRYLNFYQFLLPQKSGGIPASTPDPSHNLKEAEARLVQTFQRWLGEGEVRKLREQIRDECTRSLEGVDVFIACDSLELARLPWETWELAPQDAPLRIIRTSKDDPEGSGSATKKAHNRKPRILAILGDEPKMQQDWEILRSLTSLATLERVNWHSEEPVEEIKNKIATAIADERGWDVLFFAGHSEETELTGGRIAIAPHIVLSISDIKEQLKQARDNGDLQLAIFNSCSGLSIAESLVNLGLQVLVMREPIHNDVAHKFLEKFCEELEKSQDVADAIGEACQYLQFNEKFTYPSAYLIPSFFTPPSATPFRLEPVGWKQQMLRWLPTRKEAIAFSTVVLFSLMVPVQDLLLDSRTWVQAIYRNRTNQLPSEVLPPVLLIAIDQESINRADAEINGFQTMPMDREYLAQLVTRLSELEARVIGMDYFLTTQEPREEKLAQSIQAAVNQHNTWFVFAFSKQDNWKVSNKIASLYWSLPGDTNFFPWDVALPGGETCTEFCPFAYLLALSDTLSRQPPLTDVPQPQLASKSNFQQQVSSYLNRQQILSLKSAFPPVGLRSIIDFSLPLQQAYQRLPAWEFLSLPFPNPELQQRLQEQVVIIAPGGYEDAEDNFSVPLAVGYWCDASYRREGKKVDCPRYFTGGEAHAYMTHHLLSEHRVVLIPALWMILLAAFAGKVTTLMLWEQQIQQRQQSTIWLVFVTAALGLIGLQVYISASVAIPWFLPSVMFWTYIISSSREKKPMIRLLGVHSLLLAGAIATASFTNSANSVESATTNKDNALAAISKEHQRSTREGLQGIFRKPSRSGSSRATWERLQDIFRRRRDRGGSRGEFCSISPEEPSDKIWNTSPAFVWRGRVKRIELRHFSNNELIWSHEVTELENSQRSALYTGVPLQPGEEYSYGLEYETKDEGETITDSIDPIYLKVMDAQERLSIETELTALESSTKTLSNEELALKRAIYFANKELWFDAVTEIFSVSHPSSMWTKEMEELWQVFLSSIFWCG